MSNKINRGASQGKRGGKRAMRVPSSASASSSSWTSEDVRAFDSIPFLITHGHGKDYRIDGELFYRNGRFVEYYFDKSLTDKQYQRRNNL